MKTKKGGITEEKLRLLLLEAESFTESAEDLAEHIRSSTARHFKIALTLLIVKVWLMLKLMSDAHIRK